MWLQHVEHTWRKIRRGERCCSQISAHMHMRPTCRRAHIHKPTKHFLNLSLLLAFGLAGQCREQKDHPSTKCLWCKPACNSGVSLSTNSNPSRSRWPCASYEKNTFHVISVPVIVTLEQKSAYLVLERMMWPADMLWIPCRTVVIWLTAELAHSWFQYYHHSCNYWHACKHPLTPRKALALMDGQVRRPLSLRVW